MPRTRKRHVQQPLFRHGGKRKGAGRPAKGPRPSEPHKRRPRLSHHHPVHVTLRVAADMRSLRRRDMYKAIRWATLSVADKQQGWFHIVHASIQSNHIHLIVEAKHETALARGVQGFEVSAAKHINRTCGRKGAVFPDRYHARHLKSPRSCTSAVRYVLNNWRHHGADRGTDALVDRYSSGFNYMGWRELVGRLVMWEAPRDYEPLWVFLPSTWLLVQMHGTISARDVPGGG